MTERSETTTSTPPVRNVTFYYHASRSTLRQEFREKRDPVLPPTVRNKSHSTPYSLNCNSYPKTVVQTMQAQNLLLRYIKYRKYCLAGFLIRNKKNLDIL